MIDLFKNVSSYIIQKTCIKAIEVCPGLMQDVPDQDSFRERYIKAVKKNNNQRWFYATPMQYKTQEMCVKEVSVDPWSLWGVPEQYITQEMWNEAIGNNPLVLFLVPNCFKTQGLCIDALKGGTWRNLGDVSDCFKTQEMCAKAVKDDSSPLQFVPDWSVTRE